MIVFSIPITREQDSTKKIRAIAVNVCCELYQLPERYHCVNFQLLL